MNRHVEALAEEFLGRGHHVRVLAPFDPPGRLSRLAHRAAPEARELPDYLMPLGRTDRDRRQRRRLQPLPSSPKARHLRPAPRAAPRRLRRRPHPRAARPAGRLERGARRHVPAVGTFHAYSTKAIPNYLARRSAPAGSSTASRPGSPSPRPPPGPAGAGTAAATRSSPTASTSPPPRAGRSRPSEELRVVFVGRAEERKGLPILLSAFGALAEHVPCRLTVIGAEQDDVLRYLADPGDDALHRPPRPRLRRGALAPPARRRRALRALALGRELRHGPDRGLRRRHAGDRLGDRRLQRRRQRRRRRRPRAARATRSAWPRSCSAPTTNRSA